MVLGLVLFGAEDAEPKLNFDTPDYQSSYEYIETHHIENDTLITNLSLLASYYFRTPDKLLVQDFPEENYVNNGEDRYSGAQAFFFEEDFLRIISNKNDVWLAISHEEINGIWQEKAQDELGQPAHETDNIKVWHY